MRNLSLLYFTCIVYFILIYRSHVTFSPPLDSFSPHFCNNLFSFSSHTTHNHTPPIHAFFHMILMFKSKCLIYLLDRKSNL